ncbi:MAG TPA: hypothetical protein VKE69_14345, partial [Planctomycetota bacterium]|nr:hypothetical protein [Planctomycetota bacterium]
MARAAAVHLNGSRFEAIVLEGTAKRWKIAGFEAGDIPAPEEGATPGAAVAATVAAALKKVHAPHDPVCLTIGSSGVVFRNLTLPFTGDDAIRKVLKFESEGLLHQYNIDDVVVCHVTVAERKGASDLLIAAAPKKLLKAQIDPLEAVGYDPALVDLDALTLFNALVATGSVPATGTSLVLHVGQDSTLALLVEEGRLRFARSMRAGLGSVGRAAAADLGVPEVEAQARVRELAAKSDAGSSVGAEVEEVFVTFDEASSAGDAKTATNAHSETAKSSEELARDVVDGRRADLVKRLQRETVRTAAAEARHGLQQVFLCGEGAGLAGLAPAIEEAVGVPTREIDCLANVDGAPEGAELRRQAPIVLGAALK